MQFASLIQIDPVANHNKFYKMTQTDPSSFKAEWGRVGSTGQSATYPMADWDKKYKEKTKKGYNDVTSNSAVTSAPITVSGSTATTATISNTEVRELVEKLRKYSAQAVAANYTIEVVAVTESAIDKAQKYIDAINGLLVLNCNRHQVNHLILDLYKTIPRKIADVSKAVLQFDLDDAAKLKVWTDQMEVEQALLDAMRTQVHAAAKATGGAAGTGTKSVISILDHLGLDIEVATPTEVAMLKKLLGASIGKYVKAFAIKNFKTQAKFDTLHNKVDDKRTELFFHGSRAENWYSILENGLALRPNAVVTGKLFGHGIYFAPDADKSIGYIDGGKWTGLAKAKDAWLAVFEVIVGDPLYLTPSTKTFPTGDFSYKDLQKKGKHESLWVKAGYKYGGGMPLRKDEVIVYKEEQCTVRYLIQINM